MLSRFKFAVSVFLLFSTLFLSGCLTTGLGPRFSSTIAPPSGQALVYVYRHRVPMTGHNIPGIKVNGEQVVSDLPEVNYFVMAMRPGTYTFTPKLLGIYKTTPATINVRAGKTYFVRLKVNLGHLQFDEVQRGEAMSYLPSCYLLNRDYVNDGRILYGNSASQGMNSRPTVKQDLELSKLYVDTIPADARVRIMNIKPKYRRGMELKAGKYKIEVTAPGYQKYLKWVTLDRDDTLRLHVTLKPLQ